MENALEGELLGPNALSSPPSLFSLLGYFFPIPIIFTERERERERESSWSSRTLPPLTGGASPRPVGGLDFGEALEGSDGAGDLGGGGGAARRKRRWPVAATDTLVELFNAAAGDYHGSGKAPALQAGSDAGDDLGGSGGAASRERRRRRRPPRQWSYSTPQRGPTTAPPRCLRRGLPRRRDFLWHVDKVDFYLGAVFGSVETVMVVVVLISVLLFLARPRTTVMSNVPETTIYRRMDQYTTCPACLCCVWNRPSTAPCARGSPDGLTTTNGPRPRHV
ncbi:uncharacterized protein [Triticum aestivum]|uniref:uncharacterized protein n=1 Tax=Triticum aestivum TaxID=4565 RepID=UPI001D0338EB|nr:uncharacterized protein LOC123055915 [Triticum aestivum]